MAILVLTVAVAASPLLAGPLYSTSFNGTVGDLPTDWASLASVWEDYLVTAPANLNVDIGLSGAGNRIQTDFQSFAGVNDLGSYSTSPKSVSFTSDLGNANVVSATVASAQSNGKLGFRDRSDVTHELGALAEDFVFNLDGDRLNLTLGSLLPGHYRITTYHHDSANYIRGLVDMSVSDALSNGRTVPGAVATTGTSPTTVGSTTFSFFTDGVNPAVIHIDKGATIHASVNGFQLAPAAESLRVDFGATGQDVQNGFLAFTRGSSTTGLQTETYTSGLGTSGSVTVGLAGDNNSLSWRDRGSSTAPELPDVAEDFVFNLDYLELTLTDLAANQYLMTTYHHDLTHTGSDLEIAVWDAAGDGRIVEPALWQTVSASNDPALTSFSIYADEDPVTIRFTNLGTVGSPPIARLNGFSLTLVPEPSTALLGLIVLLGLLVRRSR